MNYKSLLIVTYGRSGSTLLQGLLNDIDGVLIKGENYNFCYSLYQSYLALVNAKTKAQRAKVSSESPTSPWFGAHEYDLIEYKEELSETIKGLLIGSNDDVRCYGFKEVRYTKVPEDEFLDYLEFLRDVFPDLGIIFNVRDINEVLKSGWWKNKKNKDTKKLLLEVEDRFKGYASKNVHSFMINYSDVINKTEALLNLYDFIGAEYNEERVDAVLSKPHSYGHSKRVLEKLSEPLPAAQISDKSNNFLEKLGQILRKS